jgi:hypothetical protein
LVRKLGASGTSREFTITTVNQATQRRTGIQLDLQVSSYDRKETVCLNRVWSVERLPISTESLPTVPEIGKWVHLAGIRLPRINAGQVELVIGSDTPEAFWVEEERRGGRGEPYAIRSILGWSILGPTGKISSSHTSAGNVNFHHMADVQDQIERLWNTDFPDCRLDDRPGMSQEDRRALSIMVSTQEREGVHYKLGLPWRGENIRLPNNKSLAVSRLGQLKRKLSKYSSLHDLYKETIKSSMKNGRSGLTAFLHCHR